MSANFGVFLPQLRMSFATIEAKAQAAEELGFHSLWLMDHMAAPAASEHDTFEGWTTATALAARTSEIRIGHLVLCDGFRHPALLAKMAATLDVISEGRLELGIGWGSVPAELRDYGFGNDTPAVRAARLAETLEILQRMFTGERFSYTGEHYRLVDAIGRPRPVQEKVPVHIGGGGERLTMPLVARYADWWNCPGYAFEHLAALRPLSGTARLSLQQVVGLAPSKAARDDVVALTERRFGTGWGPPAVGTPDEVAPLLAARVAAGVELFVLQFHDFASRESLELFAREVLPAIEEASVHG